MFEVRSVQHPEPRNFAAEMPGLIESLGQHDFPKRLFAAVRKIMNCHTVTSFAFDNFGSPRLLLAENIGDEPFSRHIAEKYMSEYWRFDPADHVDVGGDGGTACKAMMIYADDIDHASYRQYCYGAVNIDNRMTIMRSVGGRTVRLNFYRGRESGASDDGIETVVAAGETLIALLARHDSWSAAQRYGREFAYLERLKYVCPSLPKRELEVCALIMRGYSSEAIALQLGIAFNTVLTFRRRAYARLRISSQNELMRLIMS